MRLGTFLVFCLLQYITSDKAGLRLSINESVLAGAEKKFFPEIIKKISEISIPDQDLHVKVKIIGTIHIYLRKISFKINPVSDRDVIINFKEPNLINLHAHNVSGKGKFEVKFKCSIFSESDKVNVKIKKVGIKAGVQMTMKESPSEKGKFLPDAIITGIDLDLDFDFDIHGKLIAQFIKLLKSTIKRYLEKEIKKALKDSLKKEIQKEINRQINKLPTYIPIQHKGLALDYTLLCSPKILNKYLILSITGNLFDLNIPETRNPPYVVPDNIPDFDSQGKPIQIFISDYTFKTILNTLHKTERIKLKLKSEDIPSSFPIQFDTSSLDILLPGLEALYGQKKRVNFICSSNLNSTEPTIEMINNNITGLINMVCGLEANIKDELFDRAIDFFTDFTFATNLSLSENGEISVNVYNALFFNTTLTSSKIPDVKIENFEKIVDLALEILIPIVNEQFKNSTITIPTVDGISLTNSTFRISDNYLEINVNPKFS